MMITVLLVCAFLILVRIYELSIIVVKRITQCIQEEGDKVLNKANDDMNMRQEQLSKYKTICENIQNLLEYECYDESFM